MDAVQSRHKVYNEPGYICSGTLSCIVLCIFLMNLSVRTFSVYANKFLCFLNLVRKLISIWNAPAQFLRSAYYVLFANRSSFWWNLTSTQTCHTWCFPQQTLRQAKRAITIVVGVVVVVGAAVVATVGTPTAMGIAARPEVAAVLKAVGPGLAAVMKDIGPEVLAMLKDIGPEVAGAVRSLGPQIVTAVIAMMTNGFARPHQQ
jgi:hypothetical protein